VSSSSSALDFKVSTIASSDFTVFVHAHPITAAAIAAAVERVIAGYKSILEIRKLRNEYAEHNGSQQAHQMMDEDANGRMDADIEGIVDDLLNQYAPSDSARGNELRNHLAASLHQLAGRIDRGYGVEVRAGELPEESYSADDETASPLAADLAAAINVIRQSARALDFLNVEGEPILALPAPGKTTELTRLRPGHRPSLGSSPGRAPRPHSARASP
jgi:hypothetical protein